MWNEITTKKKESKYKSRNGKQMIELVNQCQTKRKIYPGMLTPLRVEVEAGMGCSQD